MNKQELLRAGCKLAQQFCHLNGLEMPVVKVEARADWRFDACAYYRPTYIAICVEKCAHIGRAGRQWSYPGYSVDRTPYGVIQHELGHHVDIVKSGLKDGYRGTYSRDMRRETGEDPLTTYCPNDAEWFAEMFRLFLTNPHMLRLMRYKTWRKLIDTFQPVEQRAWQDVLKDAPARTLESARRKVGQ